MMGSLVSCWKRITILIPLRVGKHIIQAERRVFTNFHRQVFCWLDQWHGLSLRDIRRIEAQTKIELDEVSPYSLPLLSPLLFYYRNVQVVISLE